MINIFGQMMNTIKSKKKITIRDRSINKYYSSTFPETEEIKWELNYLDGLVLKNFPNLKKLDCSHNRLTTLGGIENCAQLQELDCSRNNLTSIQELAHLTQLQVLKCHNNKIASLKELANCTMLQNLHCYSNKLATLHGLENCMQLLELKCSYNKLSNLHALKNCVQLQKLHCSYSRLKNMQGLENCTQLLELYCIRSRLTSLQGLENCVQLRKLFCFENKIIGLQGLENCAQLQDLDCSRNKIISLQGLENCAQLQDLYCSENQITNLLPIVRLRQLKTLSYYDNYLYALTASETRLLYRIVRMYDHSTIYHNSDNVLDSTIRKSIIASATNLLGDPDPPTPDFSELTEQLRTSIQAHFNNPTTHFETQMTYEKLVAYVWARIQRSDHKDTLIEIFEQDLKDLDGMCFPGRFGRTINVLSGFYDDIEIQIFDSDRINAIIYHQKDREKIIQTLREAGYDEQTIEDWTADF